MNHALEAEFEELQEKHYADPDVVQRKLAVIEKMVAAAVADGEAFRDLDLARGRAPADELAARRQERTNQVRVALLVEHNEHRLADLFEGNPAEYWSTLRGDPHA